MPTLLELLFFVEPVAEEVADALAAEDISVAWGPSYCTASTWTEAVPDAAAQQVADILKHHSVRVLRLSPIVVNAAGIADRCDVKPATVHEWTRQSDFPAPYLFIGAPAWLWHDVRRWASARPKNQVDFSTEPDALPLDAVNAFNASVPVAGLGVEAGSPPRSGRGERARKKSRRQALTFASRRALNCETDLAPGSGAPRVDDATAGV